VKRSASSGLIGISQRSILLEVLAEGMLIAIAGAVSASCSLSPMQER
jgi:hypothetical protein